MSGSDLAASPTEPPSRFWISQSISIDDVTDKFAEKETVLSNKFFCSYDPAHPTFELNVLFGSEEEDFLSVFVKSNDVQVTLKLIKFSVYGDQKDAVASWSGMMNRVMGPECDHVSWGYTMLCKADDLTDVSWKILFEGEYTYSEPDKVDDEGISPTCQLHKHWRDAWDSRTNTDVTFNVQEEKIKAHKLVLTVRSTYFANLFGAGMKESASNEVDVPDVRPDVFRALMQYLYCGTVPDLLGISMELLSVAEKYAVDELKQLCERTICKELDKSNVVDALLLAQRHNCLELLAQAILIFRMNAVELRRSEDWIKLKADPDLVVKLLHRFCE